MFEAVKNQVVRLAVREGFERIFNSSLSPSVPSIGGPFNLAKGHSGTTRDSKTCQKRATEFDREARPPITKTYPNRLKKKADLAWLAQKVEMSAIRITHNYLGKA